jgi:hypothetical protein
MANQGFELGRRIRNGVVAIGLMAVLLSAAGCTVPYVGKLKLDNSEGVTLQVESIPVKILLAASDAAIQVASSEYFGMRVDVLDLLKQVANVNVGIGVPPDDEAVLMVINKNTNDIVYWTLTDKVEAIRLRRNAPGEVEVKVINQSPLRIEMWIDGDVKEVDAVIDLKK